MTVTQLPDVARRPEELGTPELRPPRPDEVAAWVLRLLGEVSRAPFTIYRVRQVMAALARLPDQIDELIAALDRTTGVLETSLPRVEESLEDLRGTFAGVDTKIDHLDASVADLASTITNLIGSIPGARRSLRKGEPPRAG